MKRLILATIVVAAAAVAVIGCGNLFAPQGCTQTVVITDSLKATQGGDTTWHVDTLARFKLCAQ